MPPLLVNVSVKGKASLVVDSVIYLWYYYES
jgi:hypothetical protein